MDLREKVKGILDQLAEEGDEQFVSRGYGYYASAVDLFHKALLEVQREAYECGVQDAINEEILAFHTLYDGENDLAKRIHVKIHEEFRSLKEKQP